MADQGGAQFLSDQQHKCCASAATSLTAVQQRASRCTGASCLDWRWAEALRAGAAHEAVKAVNVSNEISHLTSYIYSTCALLASQTNAR